MDKDVLEKFIAITGPSYALTRVADMARYVSEPRGLWHVPAVLVLKPASTDEVSRILSLAYENNIAIVPQSGNTGLVGGQVPSKPGEVILSLERMDKIIDLDANDFSMTVEAGVILSVVQEAARQADRLFPLSLASEGSCRIGGNLSSNAGGLNVLAYGNARALCLGLEVVLPDGQIWQGLKKLRKDNTGYDLRDLFIGAEGTLGVITAAVLKLFPLPKNYQTALVAVSTPQAAVQLLGHVQDATGNRTVAFELMPRMGMEFTAKHKAVTMPLALDQPWYVLCEVADCPPETLENVLSSALEKGWVKDAVVAQSEQQRKNLWAIRELMPESQKHEGGSIKHDVSVAVSQIPNFIETASRAVLATMPGARVMCFGHLGDGNLHFNITQPIGMDEQAFLDGWEAMNDVVFAQVESYGGSISAEHGIGQLKRARMSHIKTPIELSLMRQIKKLFDPRNIMNPGKLLPDEK